MRIMPPTQMNGEYCAQDQLSSLDRWRGMRRNGTECVETRSTVQVFPFVNILMHFGSRLQGQWQGQWRNFAALLSVSEAPGLDWHGACRVWVINILYAWHCISFSCLMDMDLNSVRS